MKKFKNIRRKLIVRRLGMMHSTICKETKCDVTVHDSIFWVTYGSIYNHDAYNPNLFRMLRDPLHVILSDELNTEVLSRIKNAHNETF